jgi:acetamidase/formamidase
MAIDFHVTQIVDMTKGIHSMIPKALFRPSTTKYWYKARAAR